MRGAGKKPTGSSPSSPVDAELVEATIRACHREADRAVDGAIAILRAAGVKQPISKAFFLKLAACFRLYEWEQAGVARLVRPPLPTSDEAWDDLLTAPRTGVERFPDLATRVFAVNLWHGAWQSPSARADVMVSNVSANDVLDEMAHLLFQFRHLIDEHRPSGSEEDSNG